ncbi:MAG TPA: YdeI/OmpD-associated family protein, partial [Pyrinomonadaceae bacterium]|nr:YdeI/OmpD-associated family protein [Pyrinomonadaceae bacterium]
MPTLDPRIDAYIDNKAADFAKPILRHLRKLVHEACPDVVETTKWSMPFFDYKGPLANMASFKAHCAFGFWKQSLMESDAIPAEKTAMGTFGRITSIADLPDDKTMIGLIKQAVALNESGAKVERKAPTTDKTLVIPEVLTNALEQNPQASEHFNAFPYSKKKDYVEWINEAKTEATREKRLATAI